MVAFCEQPAKNESCELVFAAEIVQLRVARSLSSNTIQIYERVQNSKDEPDYKTVDAHPAIKSVRAHAKTRTKIDAAKTSDPTSVSVNAPAFLTRQKLTEGDQSVDDGSKRNRLPLSLSPHSPESPTEQVPCSPVVQDHGFNTEKPVLPPRARNTVDRVHSRRKQPALPPDEPVYYQEKAVSGDTVTRSGGGWPEKDLAAAVYDLPVENVLEPSFDSSDQPVEDVLTSSSQSCGSSVEGPRSLPAVTGCSSDAAKLIPRSRNLVDPMYSRPKQRVPLPDQSYSEYAEVTVVREPHAVVGNAVTESNSGVEEPLATVCDLSVKDVVEHLRRIHLDEFVDAFERHCIDGALLSNIDEEMLTTDFAMTRFQAKKLVMSVKQGWRPKITDSSS